MPKITTQAPPRPALPKMNDILDTGLPVSEFRTAKKTVVVYGANGQGKTTFCCQNPHNESIALIAIDPSPTGGASSVKHILGITVFQVAARALGQDKVSGSEKVLALVNSIKNRFASGSKPFTRVVVDGLSSWNEILLSEILKTDYNDMPAVLSKGKVSTDQYVERSEKLIRYMRPLIDLPCDVYFIAQEKDHNPSKDDKGRVVGSKLMREAHPSSHGSSWFTLALGDEQARWVQNACDYVLQMYEGEEYKEVPGVPIDMGNGKIIPAQPSIVATGRRVKRLRCTPHGNYAARCREDYRNVPEYIEAPTPEDRYLAFLEVTAGRRTKWGKYND